MKYDFNDLTEKLFAINTASQAKGHNNAHHVTSNYRNGYGESDYNDHSYDLTLSEYFNILTDKVNNGEITESQAYMLMKSRMKEMNLNCSTKDDKFLFSLTKRLKKLSSNRRYSEPLDEDTYNKWMYGDRAHPLTIDQMKEAEERDKDYEIEDYESGSLDKHYPYDDSYEEDNDGEGIYY